MLHQLGNLDTSSSKNFNIYASLICSQETPTNRQKSYWMSFKRSWNEIHTKLEINDQVYENLFIWETPRWAAEHIHEEIKMQNECFVQTYCELSNLNRLRKWAKKTSFLVHLKYKSNTCCGRSITVHPIILFRDCQQSSEGDTASFSLNHYTWQVQALNLPTRIDRDR